MLGFALDFEWLLTVQGGVSASVLGGAIALALYYFCKQETSSQNDTSSLQGDQAENETTSLLQEEDDISSIKLQDDTQSFQVNTDFGSEVSQPISNQDPESLQIQEENPKKEVENFNKVIFELKNEPKLVQKYEKSIDFTTDELVETFNKFCKINTFKKQLDHEKYKFFVNDRGTPYFSKIPLFKTEYYFDSHIKVEDIMKALHDNETRKMWDPHFEDGVPVRSAGRVGLTQIKLKSHTLDPQLRDVFEKKFNWVQQNSGINYDLDQTVETQDSLQSPRADQETQFVYFSSVPCKDSKECPEAKGVVRTHTYFGMHKFEIIKKPKLHSYPAMFQNQDQDEEAPLQSQSSDHSNDFESCVKLTMLLQVDPKLPNWKFVAYKLAMPQMTKQYYKDLVKFLEKS